IQKALVIGELNACHYANHGIPAIRHVRSPYCVVDRFKDISTIQSSAWRQQVRSAAGFSEHQTVLLFCGKFQPKKNPEILLEALAGMSLEERSSFAVLYV